MYGRPSGARHMPCGPYMPLATVWMSPSGVTVSSVPALLSTSQIVPSGATARPVTRPRRAAVAWPPSAGSAVPPPATTSTGAELGGVGLGAFVGIGLGAVDGVGLGASVGAGDADWVGARDAVGSTALAVALAA